MVHAAMQRKKRTRTDDVPVWRSPGIQSLGLDPKTQSSRSHRDLLSSAKASRRGRQSGPHGEIFGPRVHKLISFPRHLKVILSALAGAAGAVKVAGKRGGGGGFGSC